MSDVLVLTTPLRPGMTYPSANHQGADGMRFGRKSEQYRALAADVEEAARAAVSSGWETIAYPCRCWITRYVPDHRVFDAANLGGCEANALTRAGVWTDDSLARPITFDVQPGADGPDRIVIVVQRLPAPAGLAPRAARPARSPSSHGKAKREERVSATSRVPSWRPGDPIPVGYADLGGKLVPRDEAIKLLGVDV